MEELKTKIDELNLKLNILEQEIKDIKEYLEIISLDNLNFDELLKKCRKWKEELSD